MHIPATLEQARSTLAIMLGVAATEGPPTDADKECIAAAKEVGRLTGEHDEELQKAAGRVVSHMNNDHASSILAYAHAFGGDGCASAVSAKMIGLDREGFLVEVTLATGERKDVLIKYDREMKSAGQG